MTSHDLTAELYAADKDSALMPLFELILQLLLYSYL
jgi:hypothetical protein